MLDVIKPHHVSLCVLLRAFLDSEVLQVRTACSAHQASSHECYLLHLEPVQGLVTSDENYQKLGDFLLQEIRAKSSIKYPSLSELLTKLQVSCIQSFVNIHFCAPCQIPNSAPRLRSDAQYTDQDHSHMWFSRAGCSAKQGRGRSDFIFADGTAGRCAVPR